MSETRWTEKRGRRELGRWRRSGQSLSAFARQRGFNAQRLRYWRDRLAERSEETKTVGEPSPEFVPGVLVEVASAAVRLELPRGVVVEAKAAREVEPGWVAELVRALEGTT